jgi:hypothetical protein
MVCRILLCPSRPSRWQGRVWAIYALCRYRIELLMSTMQRILFFAILAYAVAYVIAVATGIR